MREYIPSAGADTSKLAGMGGVYNTVNLHLYHLLQMILILLLKKILLHDKSKLFYKQIVIEIMDL